MSDIRYVAVGQQRFDAEGNREGTIIGSYHWPERVAEAGLTGEWLELILIPASRQDRDWSMLEAAQESIRERDAEIARLRAELDQQKVYEESMYESLQHALDRGLSLEIAQLDQNGKTVGWSPFNSDNHNLRDWPVSRFRVVPTPAAVLDWHAITQAVEEMVDHYEYRGGEGDYTPTETERVLIQDAAMGVLDTIAPMLQSAEPASRSESDNQHEGLEAFDELMRNVLFLNVHERSKLERIVRKHLCESKDDVKAKALEDAPCDCFEVIGGIYVNRCECGKPEDYGAMEVWCYKANNARLRGEGSE